MNSTLKEKLAGIILILAEIIKKLRKGGGKDENKRNSNI